MLISPWAILFLNIWTHIDTYRKKSNVRAIRPVYVISFGRKWQLKNLFKKYFQENNNKIAAILYVYWRKEGIFLLINKMCKTIVCTTGSARQPRMSARQADEITTTLPRLTITPWIILTWTMLGCMCVCEGGDSIGGVGVDWGVGGGGALEPAAEALGSPWARVTQWRNILRVDAVDACASGIDIVLCYNL